MARREDHQLPPRRVAQLPAQPRLQHVVHDRGRGGLQARPAGHARRAPGADRRRVDPPAADAQALQDPHGPRDGGRDRGPRHGRRRRGAGRARAPALRRLRPRRDPRDAGRHAGRPRAVRGRRGASWASPVDALARPPRGACRSAGCCAASPRSSSTAAPASAPTAWASGRCPTTRSSRSGRGWPPFRGISHCYQRPTYADWPYQLFTMAHGRSKEECDAILDADRAETPGIAGPRDRSTARPSSRRSASCTSPTSSSAWEREHARRVSGVEHRLAAGHPLRRALRARRRRCCPAASTRPCARCARSGATRSSSTARERRRDRRRRRQPLRRLGLLVGPADPRPRAPGDRRAPSPRRPRAARRFGAPTTGEVELADEVARADAGGRDAADDLVGHRGVDERACASRARHRPREDPQVRRRLPRPRRRPARRGRLRASRPQGLPASPGVPGGRDGDDRDRAVERRRRGRAPATGRTSSRRSSPSRTRPTWASSRPPRASSSCCASAPTATGALLVFDEVITGFRVARGGAQERTGVHARPRGHGQGHRRRAARRGLRRRARELMERIAPAGDVYQAGTLSGNPLAVAAGLRRCGCSTSPPTCASRPRPRRSPTGLREAAAAASVPVTVATAPGPADRLLLRRARRATTPARRRCDLDAYGAWCRGAAGPRRLPAAVAVRGVVPVARPRRTSTSSAPSRPRRRRSPRFAGCATRAALRRLAGALRERGRPARRRAASTRRAPRTTPASARSPRPARAPAAHRRRRFVVEAIREGYLLHYGAGRVARATTTATSPCSPATASTRSASRALAALGDLEAVAELADVISLCAQAHAEGDPAARRGGWEAGAAAVGWGADGAVRAQRRRARRARRPQALRAAARQVSATWRESADRPRRTARAA